MLQGGQGKLTEEEELHCRLSQGWPHLLTDMRIVNADGKELPRDGKSSGELQVSGPHVVQSYFKVGLQTVNICCFKSLKQGPQCCASLLQGRHGEH